MPERILIVDDEKEIADLVAVYLENENITVFKCYTAKAALECIAKEDLDLAILDVMLPDMSGFEICQRIRKQHNYPVIMLTAKIEATDKITGLTLGADDYITKPFIPLELVARVKAQLRRYTRYNANAAEGYDCDGLHLEPRAHICTLYDEPVSLTPTEFNILWLLCQRAGTVVSSQEIFETVWGETFLDSNNTVMVHIRRIREKLGEPAKNPRYIKTVWGVGYKIEKTGH